MHGPGHLGAEAGGLGVVIQALRQDHEDVGRRVLRVHDGGVVVRGNRIMYAACIFPLTRRIDINNSLGTRHRAAIGLSEETDAIVVLVSEETGDISYCHNGALHRQVSLKKLKDFLVDQLKSDAPSKKPASTPLQRLRDSLRAVLNLIEKKLRPDPR